MGTGDLPMAPSLRCIPSADHAFAEAAESALASGVRNGLQNGALCRWLIDNLADRYPGADARPMNPLAAVSPDHPVIYVFRGGH